MIALKSWVRELVLVEYLKSAKIPSMAFEDVMDIRRLNVLDVGTGESTKVLVNKGARITVAIDTDLNKTREKSFEVKNAFFICGDAAHLPLRERSFDITLFHFTLHEIDPRLHLKVLNEAKRVASRIVIVEPSPEGCRSYKKYADLWRKAMHSIGRYEDYKPITYWANLVKKCGFIIEYSSEFEQKESASLDEIERNIKNSVKAWRDHGVPEGIIREMEEFTYVVRKDGFKWSRVAVIVGRSSQP